MHLSSQAYFEVTTQLPEDILARQAGQEPSSIQVSSTDTIGDLKKAIVSAKILQGVVMSLVLGEYELDDSMNKMSLADVGVEEGADVHFW